MKRFQFIFTLLLMLVLVPVVAEANDALEVERTHLFKVHFSQPVDAQKISDYIELTCDCETDYEVELARNGKTVELRSQKPLIVDKTYTVVVSDGLPAQNGQTLKEARTQQYVVKKLEQQYAPIHAKFDDLLTSYKMAEGDGIRIYGGANISQQTMEELVKDYDANMLPYFTSLFPEIANSPFKPTVVMLGNEADIEHYKAGGAYVSANASGWISYADNVIVMTNDNANKILLSHEYVHWMFANVYDINIPSWINEAAALIYSWSYYENETDALNISIVNNYISAVFNETNMANLHTAYSNESISSIAMLLHEYGLQSMHDWAIASQQTAVESAWQDVYNVSFTNMEQYVYEAKAHYEALYGEVLAYDKTINLKPIPANTLAVQRQLLPLYSIYETPVYRVYASKTVTPELIKMFVDYGNGELTDVFGATKTTRPLFILLTGEDLQDIPAFTGLKQGMISYGKVPNSIVLVTAVGAVSSSLKDTVKKYIENYVR